MIIHKKIAFLLVTLFFVSGLFKQLSCNPSQDKKEYQQHYSKAYSETDYDEALIHGFAALEIAKDLSNDTLIASSLVAISQTHIKFGNLASGLDFSLKAEPYYKKINEEESSVMIYFHIAGIYYNLNNYQMAIKYYKESLKYKTNYPIVKVGSYLNIGECYRKLMVFDSAMVYLEHGKKLDDEIETANHYGYYYANKGLILESEKATKQADSLLNKAITIFKNEKNYIGIIQTYLELAKIKYKFNQKGEALKYANIAYEIADSNQFKLEIQESSELLANLYEENSDFEKAYRYLNIKNSLGTKIKNDSVFSKIAEMRAEFEISQNEAEMIFLKRINKARTRLLLVAIVGLVLIAILSVFLFRLTQKQRKNNELLSEQNHELDQKNHIINEALKEKEMLMKEIHHRVKNNLQIISSIISLQRMRIENDDVSSIFEEMQRRILAISSIHQKLYQSESVSSINMKDYIEEVVDSIHSAFNNESLNVTYEIAIQNVNFNIDAAVSLGLIVNELATNAYKYAFSPGKDNYFLVKLQNDNEKSVLIIRDSGPGLKNDFTIENAESLGLRMVNLLTRQMRGKVEFNSTNGAEFQLTFPKL